MKKVFKDLVTFIRLHDGMNKPKINFQDLYRLFPQFTFRVTEKYGTYSNFGQAFEAKNFSMFVTDGKNECMVVYKEYGDTDENLAYIVYPD